MTLGLSLGLPLDCRERGAKCVVPNGSGDFAWTRIDQKYSGTVVAPALAGVAKPGAVYDLKDQDSFNFLLRAQREF